MSKDAMLEMITREAFDAAAEAEAKYRAQYGEPFYCGFAWVNIKPGNCAIANYLKKKGEARKSYHGGVDVWNPGKSGTQSMDIKEQGADAFAAVLRKYGFKASAMSRAD
jgi:hypothetical protein